MYSSSPGANESTLDGSVTVRAVILAPTSFAKRIPCSTALAARSDPSVATRMFLNNVGLLLSLLPRDAELADNQVAGRHRSECTASSLRYGPRPELPTMGVSAVRPCPFQWKRRILGTPALRAIA